MPLDRYGVLSGQLVRHHRDEPDNQGRWFHVNLAVRVGQADYRCAIDVDSHASNIGVEWRGIPIEARAIAAMTAKAPGYYDLAHTATSGALDYVRGSWLRERVGVTRARGLRVRDDADEQDLGHRRVTVTGVGTQSEILS